MASGTADGEWTVDTTTALLLAWTPWVAAAASYGVVFADGLGTVLGMELQGPSLLVAAGAVATWLTARWWLPRHEATRPFGTVGLVVVAPVVWLAATAADTQTAGWLALAAFGSLALGVWGRRAVRRHGGSSRASHLAGFVVFGQSLDALTTAVGVDVLGYGEQNALSRAILSATEGLPLTALTGTSWVFIAVKLALAVAVVAVFVDAGEQSRENTLVVAVATFAGLGPAVHNAVLFATA